LRRQQRARPHRSSRRPGIDIEAPWLGGSTIKSTGNSFAAPHIAGLVTRILGNHSA
jgi:hypothetical protein